jgi:hypothetical protein
MCVIRNTFYNKELRILIQKRSWNKELRFGTRSDTRGLSETVSVLILLVVAVLLTSVTTYYATNITLTRTKGEEVRISKERVWVNGSGAVAAFKVQNLGGRDILVGGIRVRGVELDWADVYYYYRVPTGSSVTGELNRTSYASLTGSGVTIDSVNYNRSRGNLPLITSGSIIFYARGPGNVQTDDVGTTIDLSIYTNNDQNIAECNVESATNQ